MVGKVGLSPSLRETRGSDVANVQHGDAKLGNACKTTVSREKRKAMLLCGGDVKGIVCAYVVAKSPSASNQRPMRDAVNRPFKKRIDSGYCAIFADPPAQRLSAQSRQYFGVHQFRRYLAGPSDGVSSPETQAGAQQILVRYRCVDDVPGHADSSLSRSARTSAISFAESTS